MSIVQRLQQSLAANDAEPAHLKTIGMSEGSHGVANLVSSDTPAVLSLASNCHTRQADVIVNARVAVDPQVLEEHVQAAVRSGVPVAECDAGVPPNAELPSRSSQSDLPLRRGRLTGFLVCSGLPRGHSRLRWR